MMMLHATHMTVYLLEKASLRLSSTVRVFGTINLRSDEVKSLICQFLSTLLSAFRVLPVRLCALPYMVLISLQ